MPPSSLWMVAAGATRRKEGSPPYDMLGCMSLSTAWSDMSMGTQGVAVARRGVLWPGLFVSMIACHVWCMAKSPVWYDGGTCMLGSQQYVRTVCVGWVGSGVFRSHNMMRSS